MTKILNANSSMYRGAVDMHYIIILFLKRF